MARHLPHHTARNARFLIGILNAVKMGILSAGQHPAPLPMVSGLKPRATWEAWYASMHATW